MLLVRKDCASAGRNVVMLLRRDDFDDFGDERL